jgi:hypothetical protein
MKYLSTVNKVYYLEEAECELLQAVRCGKGTKISTDPWGNGWIFEADEYFPSFCVIKYGFEPTEITDDEYRQLLSDGATWIDKTRSNRIRAVILLNSNIAARLVNR